MLTEGMPNKLHKKFISESSNLSSTKLSDLPIKIQQQFLYEDLQKNKGTLSRNIQKTFSKILKKEDRYKSNPILQNSFPQELELAPMVIPPKKIVSPNIEISINKKLDNDSQIQNLQVYKNNLETMASQKPIVNSELDVYKQLQKNMNNKFKCLPENKDTIKNINSRYTIKKIGEESAYGGIYRIDDLENKNYPLVVKETPFRNYGKIFSKLKDEDPIIFANQPLSQDALKYDVWIELLVLRLSTELHRQNICPNVPILLDYTICNNCDYVDCTYPEIEIGNYFPYQPMKDGMKMPVQNCTKRKNCILYWTELGYSNARSFLNKMDEKTNSLMFEETIISMIFQVLIGLYSLQFYFGINHFDLHLGNILVMKNKDYSKGTWEYIINKKSYFLPVFGFYFCLWDFGYATIPSKNIRNELLENNNRYYSELKGTKPDSKETQTSTGYSFLSKIDNEKPNINTVDYRHFAKGIERFIMTYPNYQSFTNLISILEIIKFSTLPIDKLIEKVFFNKYSKNTSNSSEKTTFQFKSVQLPKDLQYFNLT